MGNESEVMHGIRITLHWSTLKKIREELEKNLGEKKVIKFIELSG